jgi:hypothetical protein
MAMATPGESTGTPCQCQNDPRQDQLAHTHYNHPTPGFMILEHDLFGKPVPTFPDHALNARFHRLEVPGAMPDCQPATLSSAGRRGQSTPPRYVDASATTAACRSISVSGTPLYSIRSKVFQPIRAYNFSLCGVNK